MKFYFSFLFCFVLLKKTVAQDVIYLISGTKISAKIIEIGILEIKYKNFNNLNGPNYILVKNEVVLVNYENGTTEIFNTNPISVAPNIKPTQQQVSLSSVVKNNEFNVNYINSNLLSINALGLANGDFTLMYDKDICTKKLGLSFLGTYNFSSGLSGFNPGISQSLVNSKKIYEAGFGLNFYPKQTKRIQYFVGILSKYMAFNYQKIKDSTNNQLIYKKATANQISVMLTNGWIYRITPNFNFKIFMCIGLANTSVALKKEYVNLPKMYLGYCFGYRF